MDTCFGGWGTGGWLGGWMDRELDRWCRLLMAQLKFSEINKSNP